jgi:hypothetical protein
MISRSEQDPGSFDKNRRYSRHAVVLSTLPDADDLPARWRVLVRRTAAHNTDADGRHRALRLSAMPARDAG